MNVLVSDLQSGVPSALLWGGALFLALTLFGQLMKKRREQLTNALKKHVAVSIEPPDGEPPSDPIKNE